jgi:acyl-CoA hydrolase
LAGKTSLVSYVRAIKSKNGELLVDGFITFVHVDHAGRPLPHGITIEAVTPADISLQEKAKAL